MKNLTTHRAMTFTKLVLLLACGFFMEMSAPSKMFRNFVNDGIAALYDKQISPPHKYQFNNASLETKMTLPRLEIDQIH